MKTYQICLGAKYIEIQAKNEKDAIEKAIEFGLLMVTEITEEMRQSREVARSIGP